MKTDRMIALRHRGHLDGGPFQRGRIAERFPDARLVMAGDGELREDLERHVLELNLGERVRFTGWVRDIRSIYGVIDVAMLTSLNEGTPLALFEALAAGRPVIATAVGGVEDIVTHEQTGLLVAPADVDAVVATLYTRLLRERRI